MTTGPTNPNRVSKGVPTGGQFAASAHAESEVTLGSDDHGDNQGDQNTTERYGVNDAYPNGRCQACGSGVDENGSCYQSDCSRFDEDSPYDDDDDDDDDEEGYGDSEELFDFQVPGSSSTFQVRLLDDGDEDPEYEVYRDGTYIGSVDYNGDPEAHDEIEEAAIRTLPADMQPAAGRSRADGGASIAKIVDAEAREAATEYAARYGTAPQTVGEEVDWDRQHQVPARDLAVGQRLAPFQRAVPDSLGHGQVISRVEHRHGMAIVYCDGETVGKADLILNHGDPVTVHDDRVDLTDPDWFEVEASRITAAKFAHRYPGGAPRQEDYDDVAIETRRTLTRLSQPTNISPIFHDGPGSDPRTANGRAKVGDNVIFTQPMYGDSSYEVLGKKARRDITGHDGTQVTWGENGDVEYVLRNISTGHQQTADLRGAGWRRIPAPGDYGPGAQAQAQTRVAR